MPAQYAAPDGRDEDAPTAPPPARAPSVGNGGPRPGGRGNEMAARSMSVIAARARRERASVTPVGEFGGGRITRPPPWLADGPDHSVVGRVADGDVDDPD